MCEQNKTSQNSEFRPSLNFYHANAKGTGCAVKFELHPAHDRTDGSIFMSLARQLTVGERTNGRQTFPRFDWENKLVVKLDFSDLSKMLMVFRGECENLEDNKGLFHSAPGHSTRICLRHLLEPIQGYSLEVYRSYKGAEGRESGAHIILYPHEALGLCESIAGAMAVISFGIPQVIPHDVSTYTAEIRRSRDEQA